MNPVLAVAVGVTLILLFGEIIPQALCSRWGLAIGMKVICHSYLTDRREFVLVDVVSNCRLFTNCLAYF